MSSTISSAQPVKPLSEPAVVVLGTTIHSLPMEIIHYIFGFLSDTKERLYFQLVNRTFFLAVQRKRKLKDFIPSYITNTSNFAVKQLGDVHKTRLAINIEKKMLSKDSFPVLFKCEHVVRSAGTDVHFPKTLINHYFIFAATPDSSIHIFNLKTKTEKIVKVHESTILGCSPIQADKNLLMTMTLCELKIWDFDRLAGSEQESALLLRDKSRWFAKAQLDRCNYVDSYLPVFDIHDHLLGVGYHDRVKIFDCRQLSNPASCVSIPFHRVRQIQLTDAHVMLISINTIAIWELSRLQQLFQMHEPITLGSPSFTYILDYRYRNESNNRDFPVTVRFAKLFQDKIIIAYDRMYYRKEIHSYVSGEVRNTQGELIKLIVNYSSPVLLGTFTSVDVRANVMAAASHAASRHDLSSSQHIDGKWGRRRGACKLYHTVYIIGRHALFVNSVGVHIQSLYGDSVSSHGERVVGTRNSFMQWNRPVNYGDRRLHAFELNGAHLITETRYNSISEKRSEIKVYDLSIKEQ